MMQIIRYCGDCGGEHPFEQPHDRPGQCPDSTDGECAEWLCTACGAALLISVVVAMPSGPAVAAQPRRRVA
jgi:hypothetical protein